MAFFEGRQPEVIKRWNNETTLVMDRGSFYVLKQLPSEDLGLAKTLMEVNSPHIARILGVELLDGTFFAVQEYVEGVTLEEYLRESGPLDAEKTRQVALELCDGLEALHARGIVHRDLTPKNIVVTAQEHVTIIDFGISRVERAGASSDTEFLGTAGFAAPEQFGFKQSTARTDIYSLGVLMNYMQTMEFPNEHLAEGKLKTAIETCTKMDEADRYPSVRELRKVLENDGKSRGELPALPGFRKGVWWHKVIASLYYFSAVMTTLTMFFLPDYGLHGRLLVPIAFALMLLAPVPIFFNYGNWVSKLPPKGKKPQSIEAAWMVLTYLLAFFVAVIIIVLV